ncbi:MAG: SusC/RagA family TonB-linked outer membrane protein [Pseudobacter sp.]|uniref:SusC/RagA family TonB-linked outer membrane protein n=1 Tax=Pseudobacter sp. TaxID=2045420 RepID=UPI003F7F700B
MSEVFKKIKAQAGVDFFISHDLMKESDRVTINVKNVELTTVLDQLFKNQRLTYSIEDKFVVISRREAGSPANPEAPLPLMEVSGRIVDAKGNAISGATITVKGTNLSVVSSANGDFLIKAAGEKPVIIISCIGFKTKELPATAKMGEILLDAVISVLDEVRIVAYGTESRRLAIGAVGTVKAEDIEKQPVLNPLAALQGQVPGLNVTQASGAPGAAIRIQIRGQNSLSQNAGSAVKPYSQPLFIIDGVPVAAQNANLSALYSLGGYGGLADDFGGSSPFNGINPADIESISILKDVSATAIYGTQGANGVILITTKKGKTGKLKIQATYNTAFNTATRKIHLLNTEQYLAYRREALVNDGIDLSTASPAEFPDLLLFDQNRQTDWYRFYLGNTSNTNNAHVSLSGGSGKTTFFVSTGYTKAEYNFPGNFADKRFTLHSKVNYKSADDRFTIGFGYDYSYQKNNTSASASLVSAMLTPPNFPDLLDAFGKPNWNFKGFNTGRYVQSIASLKQPSLLQVYNMTNSLVLGYNILDGLKFNINAGYSRIVSDQEQRMPASTIDPSENPVSKSVFSNTVFETINIEPQLEYQRNFGNGSLTALIGGTYKSNAVSNVQLQGTNYSDEALMGSIASAGRIEAVDSDNPYKYAGAFARLSYTHDQKYILQVSGRRDASSNFGPGRQFGNFGSAGLGWIFSNERFFERASRIISYGKLSGSYGTVGSDATTPYQYQQLFRTENYTPDFQGLKPLFVQNLFNPDYGWDSKQSFNAALDLGFWGDRVLLNVTYYRDRIGNQLVDYTLPSQTGFGSVLSNFNAVIQNQGLEFSLTSRNITTKNFSWSTSLNISGNRNKLIAFPGLEESPYGILYTIGESVNIVKGFRLKGVNPETGIFEFYTSKGEVTANPIYGVPSQGGDYEKISNLDPQFMGGLANTITYKNLSIYFLFQFQKQQQVNYLRAMYSGIKPGGLINAPVDILDRWTTPGQVTSIQKLTASYGEAYNTAFYFTQSSGAYSDGSYIRLRTASVSYTLPTAFCSKLGVADARFFVNGQNLFLITGYKVGDPELNNLFSFPLQRTVALGININL